MRLLKLALPVAVFTGILFTGGMAGQSQAEAQASQIVSDTMPAREIATPAEDIALTNSCIEGGKEKFYCVCKTKIFKNEMSLRDYRGAVALYEANPSAKLTEMGYDAAEITLINEKSKELTDDDMFRTRCDTAETFFAASNQT